MGRRGGVQWSSVVCTLVCAWVVACVALATLLPNSGREVYEREIRRRPRHLSSYAQRETETVGAMASEGGGLWTLESAVDSPSHWLERSRLLVERNAEFLAAATLPSGAVTLVSGLFDLGRGDLDNAFKRPFAFYVERFEAFLRYNHPKVIFVEERYWQAYYQPLVKQYHSEEHPIHVIFKSVEDIEEEFPFFEEVEQIRTSRHWAAQTGVGGWLSQSPQATLRLYNPMVMSKIYWTRDVARLNPFGTDSFMWIDGGHNCNDPEGLQEEQMRFFPEKMFDRLMITYFDYQPAGEIHGFEKNAFFRFTGVEDVGPSTEVIVGRGGIFGGTREYLEVATLVYHEMLAGSLAEGYMGTEENIFALLWYRTPELVRRYDNKEGGNCAVFSEAVHGPPPPPIIWEDFVRDEGFLLRGCQCYSGGSTSDEEVFCVDEGGNRCPPHVTPMFLTKAEDQYACKLRDEYFCTVGCGGGGISWFAHSCAYASACPPPKYAAVPFGQQLTEL